jgi:hypothetical protein
MTEPTWSIGGQIQRADPSTRVVAPGAPAPAPAVSRSSNETIFRSDGRLPMERGITRDAAWAMLGPKTRQRMQQLAGTTIEWWAETSPHREDEVRGYVLGDQGFSLAEPARDAQSRSLSRINCYHLDPASFRHVNVDWRPPERRLTRPPGAGAGPSSDPLPPAVRGIDPMDQRLIGSMPAQSQRLLLDPFVTGGEQVLRCALYYEGTQDVLDVFAVVLAGSRTLTAATGSRFTPAGYPEADSHWTLVCRRAAVLRRTGR